MKPLTRTKFDDALRKGQGRAFQHIQRHGIAGGRDILVNACVKNLAYDPQCEARRDEWLMSLLDLAGDQDWYRERILAAVPQASKHWDLGQLLNLAMHFARRGSLKARRAIYDRFDQHDFRESWLGGEQIVALDGIGGLLHVAEVVGGRLERDPDPWESDGLVSEAGRLHGREMVELALRQRAEKSPPVQAYLNAVIKMKEEFARGRTAPRYKIAIETILTEIESAAGQYPGRFTTFGRTATDSELEQIFGLLLVETRPAQRLRCLWVFRRRAFPRLDARLFSLAESADEQTQAAALPALSQCDDPRVNALAIRLLGQSPQTIKLGVLRMFMRNYRPGDHEAIHAALHSSPPQQLNRDDRHNIGYDLLEMAKAQSDPELATSLEWVYEHSPCSYCRGKALKRLVERNCARTELLHEALWDCSARTRDIARQVTSSRNR